jgi:GxxExxY protein
MIFDKGLLFDDSAEQLIICELNAVEELNPVWKAKILSHLRLTGKRLGFHINFNESPIKMASIELYYNLCGLVP